MPKFQIVMPHDPAQCIEALDETMAHDPDLHSQLVYGCRFGDDTGYALIEASSEEEIRSRIPSRLRKKARVVEVEHVRPEDIRAHHHKLL